MKIKVCGLKEPENITAVAGLNPDYAGFIRYKGSPRFLKELPVKPLQSIPDHIVKTGVFVNESIDAVHEAIVRYGFKAVQLHGTEDEGYCAEFKDNVEVIKAFGLDESFNFEQLDRYAGIINYFLFDTKSAAHGGSGKLFDWELLNNYKMDIPFFLSGGLSLDNLADIKKIKHPAFYGVDLNSRFETTPGVKDIEKLKQAFKLLRTNEIRS